MDDGKNDKKATGTKKCVIKKILKFNEKIHPHRIFIVDGC